jgi:4-diphosphocytidyl-2-C-methyl-D-erythritol kinase
VSVTVRAPAKINLHLGVGPVRDDGYHPLSTVYQAIGLYDDVTVVDAAAWSIGVESDGRVDVSSVPLDDSNLAVRAGRLLVEHHGIERAASISVHKGIPVAGGLAGGSADAAATLVALDRLWDLHTTDDDLLALAARLGSDVPFALLGGTAYGTGRGELVEPVTDHGAWWWVVLTSDVGLSTPAVYAAFDHLGVSGPVERPEGLLQALATGDPDVLAAELHNDLELAALSLRPGLGRLPELLIEAGAFHPLLSGSGPTWLGLASGHGHAHEITELLAARGVTRVLSAPGPVAGAHVVEYV